MADPVEFRPEITFSKNEALDLVAGCDEVVAFAEAAGELEQFSVLTGTIFHGTKVSLVTWLTVMVQMCSAKNGISAREVERMHGVTPETAWYMLHRVREAMKREPLVGLLTGTIVADETWIGGKPKNKHRQGRPARISAKGRGRHPQAHGPRAVAGQQGDGRSPLNKWWPM
jgi:hypothetical protein